mmetsp:Transcript_11580/g.32882  ORF Transcript_11580/g.32882 Transcript_11580/m.32882 type:complete len:233 (-) Transcript_11580:1307-2005(-)
MLTSPSLPPVCVPRTLSVALRTPTWLCPRPFRWRCGVVPPSMSPCVSSTSALGSALRNSVPRSPMCPSRCFSVAPTPSDTPTTRTTSSTSSARRLTSPALTSSASSIRSTTLRTWSSVSRLPLPPVVSSRQPCPTPVTSLTPTRASILLTTTSIWPSSLLILAPTLSPSRIWPAFSPPRLPRCLSVLSVSSTPTPSFTSTPTTLLALALPRSSPPPRLVPMLSMPPWMPCPV